MLTELRKMPSGENVTVYTAGFRITDIAADMSKRLTDLIKSHGSEVYGLKELMISRITVRQER